MLPTSQVIITLACSNITFNPHIQDMYEKVENEKNIVLISLSTIHKQINLPCFKIKKVGNEPMALLKYYP